MKLVFVPLKDVFKECKGKRQFSIKKDAYRRFSSVSNEMQIGIKKIAALYASKGSDTIEVAYLNGVDTPYIDQMEGFSVDGVTTKVRIDAGVAPVDHRGLVKCTA